MEIGNWEEKRRSSSHYQKGEYFYYHSRYLRLISRPNSVQDDVKITVESTLDVVRPSRAAVGLVGDGHEPHLVDSLESIIICFNRSGLAYSLIEKCKIKDQ